MTRRPAWKSLAIHPTPRPPRSIAYPTIPRPATIGFPNRDGFAMGSSRSRRDEFQDHHDQDGQAGDRQQATGHELPAGGEASAEENEHHPGQDGPEPESLRGA